MTEKQCLTCEFISIGNVETDWQCRTETHQEMDCEKNYRPYPYTEEESRKPLSDPTDSISGKNCELWELRKEYK